MLLYTYSDYQKDINLILDYIKENNIQHIVGIFRGSLPLAVTLSNRAKIPMSIIDFQTRDGNSKEPIFIKKNFTLKDNFKKILIIDDIYDTGLTLNSIYKLYPQIKYFTLFKKKGIEPIIPLTWLRETSKWVHFEVWE